tara:strand:+ start:126 stop:299 length:174 start_codon:yes stop_codon:yes gene_type:complete
MTMEDTMNLIEEAIDHAMVLEDRNLFKFSEKETWQVVRLIVQCRLSAAEPYKYELQE